MCQQLQLADHVGSLLQVDEAIEALIKSERQVLKSYAEVSDDKFWSQAMNQVYTALHEFYQEAESTGRIERRLFAAEGEQGFRFLNVLRQRYDVVVMNPPFGSTRSQTSELSDYLGQLYKASKSNVYCAFVERALSWTKARGFVGALTPRDGFFIKTTQRWREEVILSKSGMLAMADLGMGILDGAMNEVAATILRSEGGSLR